MVLYSFLLTNDQKMFLISPGVLIHALRVQNLIIFITYIYRNWKFERFFSSSCADKLKVERWYVKSKEKNYCHTNEQKGTLAVVDAERQFIEKKFTEMQLPILDVDNDGQLGGKI